MSKEKEEKWPPLEKGTRVKTLRSKTKKGNWTPEAWKSRKWGVEGIIVAHHDSHGLCYDVDHGDGSVGVYDPSELKVIK